MIAMSRSRLLSSKICGFEIDVSYACQLVDTIPDFAPLCEQDCSQIVTGVKQRPLLETW